MQRRDGQQFEVVMIEGRSGQHEQSFRGLELERCTLNVLSQSGIVLLLAVKDNCAVARTGKFVILVPAQVNI